MNLDPGTWNPADPVGGHAAIPRGMTCIAQMLKDKGDYSTHFIGKWDNGMATPDQTPRGRGYDSALLYFYHENDFWNYTVDDDGGAGPKSCDCKRSCWPVPSAEMMVSLNASLGSTLPMPAQSGATIGGINAAAAADPRGPPVCR